MNKAVHKNGLRTRLTWHGLGFGVGAVVFLQCSGSLFRDSATDRMRARKGVFVVHASRGIEGYMYVDVIWNAKICHTMLCSEFEQPE